MVPWVNQLTQVHNPNGNSIGSAIFAGLTNVTDHATLSVTIGRIFLHGTAMLPKNHRWYWRNANIPSLFRLCLDVDFTALTEQGFGAVGGGGRAFSEPERECRTPSSNTSTTASINAKPMCKTDNRQTSLREFSRVTRFFHDSRASYIHYFVSDFVKTADENWQDEKAGQFHGLIVNEITQI